MSVTRLKLNFYFCFKYEILLITFFICGCFASKNDKHKLIFVHSNFFGYPISIKIDRIEKKTIC